VTPEVLTAVGWCVAALLACLHLRARQRLVLVARASHELRGPLCAARLGLGTIAGEPGRVAAIDLELARAGRALDDLTAAPSGARPPDHRSLVEIDTLARSYAPSWTTLARAHGASLRVEIDGAPRPRARAETAPRVHRRHLHAVPAPVPVSSRADDPAAPGAAGESPEAVSRRAGGPASAPPEPLPPTWRADGPPAPWVAADARSPRAAADASTAVFADPFRIAQAVSNLVSNAAEHGGGVVRVRVRRTGERVWIEVADDGPGLPAPVRAMVSAARSRAGRRGHGLAIAAGIAEQLGGRLAALPATTGARIVLDLPAAR
jgi:signal transduction histidine kinase